MYLRIVFFALSLFLLMISTPVQADVIADPMGITVAPDVGEETVATLLLRNIGDEEVAYALRMQARDLGIGRDAPGRDLGGGPDQLENVWRDDQEDDGPLYQWIEIRNREGVIDIPDLLDDSFHGLYDLGFAFPYYGEEYRTIGVHSNGFATFVEAREIVFYWPAWTNVDLPNANPGAADQTPPPTLMAVNYQDLNPAVAGNIYFWTDNRMAVVTWQGVPHFSDQGENPLPWTFQLILTSDGLIKYQFNQIGRYDNADMMLGVQNEERNMGFTFIRDNFEYLREGRCVAFGPPGAWVNWVHQDPVNGAIGAGEEIEIEVSFVTEDIDAGYYWADIIVRLDNGQDNIILPLIMSLDSPVGGIRGRITDAANNQPVSGAAVHLEPIGFIRYTDENGNYEMTNLPPRAYTVTCITGDYFDEEFGEVEVEAGEIAVVSMELVHAECTPDPAEIRVQLEPGNEVYLDLTVTNGGNAPLSYRVERRLFGDADAEPWSIRRSYNFGQILNDDRLEGVVFTGERFYVSGAAGGEPNTIYILDGEGELIDQFDQPGESVYGMKDLEWDGELIWGSGERRVFGFTPEGETVVEFAGPYNPNTVIAYDSNNDLLWVAATTNDIVAFDREGNRIQRTLSRKGFRLYGLSYWPDDPDGYPLYVSHSPQANDVRVHKMDPERNGDTLFVHQIYADGGVAPSGTYITNEFDIYSWVMLSVANIPRNNGNDRIDVFQVDARRDWFGIEPSQGVIAAGAEQQFDVHLDARSLPLARFEGEFLFVHNGIGSQTSVPVTLDIVEGRVNTFRDIHLERGWNLVSANLQPENEDVTVITRPLVEANQLLLMKDGFGRFYAPGVGFNNIPGWFVSQGYWMKMAEAAVLRVSGLSSLADDPIDLTRGWNLVSYYPRRPVAADVALSGIVEHLLIAKDGFGNFYVPEWGFNNMSPMAEGRGYQLKVDEDIELIYRTGQMQFVQSKKQKMTGDVEAFNIMHNSGKNMSLLLLTAHSYEGYIKVFAGDRQVGLGYAEDGLCGIAVWGDDLTTQIIDGALEGEDLRISSPGLELQNLKYSTDGFEVIDGRDAKPILVSEFELMSIYPNPFNSRATLRFSLPEASFIDGGLFDITGRRVQTLVSGYVEAGNRTVDIDATGLASGVYWVHLEANGVVRRMKVVAIK